jgi:spermidine synthase
MLFFLLFLTIPSAFSKEIIFQNDNYTVYDIKTETDNLRYLEPNNSNLIHGFISVDSPLNIHFEYMKTLLSVLYIQPKPKNILIIGLGAGILPKFFDTILSQTTTNIIDIVELDPLIVDLAIKYFYFKTSNRVRIHVQNGFDYIMSLNNSQTYDIIIMDAYLETFCQPDEFYSQKFITKLKKHLNKNNGVVGYNFLTLCFRHNQEINLLKMIFKHYFISYVLEGSNRIFLGIEGRSRISIKKIISNAYEWEKVMNNNKWVLERFNFINNNEICYLFDYYFMFFYK